MTSTSTATATADLNPTNGLDVALSGSTQYTASAWLYSDSASIAVLALNAFAGGAYNNSYATSWQSLTAGVWQQASFTFTTGSGVTAGNIQLEIVSPSGAGVKIWWDQLQVETGASVSAWVPGPGDPAAAVPVASFTYTPSSGIAPLAVAFTGSGTNSPTSWAWDFGDSSTSTSQSPSHTYTAAGTYTASLVATNSNGPSTAVTHTVTVTGAPATPSNLHVVTVGQTTVDLAWNAVSGATGYELVITAQ